MSTIEDSPVKVEEKQSLIRKFISNISVEPLIICWLLPYLLSYSAVENLTYEKACRGFVEPPVTFQKDICKLFVRKDLFDIKCDGSNVTSFEDLKVKEIEKKYPEIYNNVKSDIKSAMNFLCEIEEKVQEKISLINSIRNPISAIGPLIIVLFAGPWSDKKNLRVPCMIVPLLGEAIGYLSLFISAYFINGPVEFPLYAYLLIPSLTGAETLMVMAIFSYLSAISTEENRTFRFGMFNIIMTIIPIIAQSLSPSANNNFEYTGLFGMMIPVHVIGLLYGIFFLKEVKQDKKEPTQSYDNPAFVVEANQTNNENTLEIIEPQNDEKAKNACAEFFDPRLAVQCIQTLIKKRDYGARSILILLMVMHFLVSGITNGEIQNIFLYQRLILGWDIDTNTYHNVFTIVLGLIGTLLMVGVLSKILKISDIILALISTALTVLSRVIYSIVTSTIGFFTGSAVDFTASVKLLAVRSIISKLVPAEDLSSMFAIMGIFNALAGMVFPTIYPLAYKALLENANRSVSEIFHLSAALFLIAFIVYSLVFKLLKTKEEEQAEEQVEDKPDKP
ncbi:CLUMA_CG014356, isoform A [Clunio marinus]|uniref:CLUMA_CG014356, isoform A n=1 Tax=Clunio marinus TaxID=568069 RepID=A0A1J1IP31_9DIPT|nr:CLUMA_CG014356, isoform A [Clunio marinus]